MIGGIRNITSDSQSSVIVSVFTQAWREYDAGRNFKFDTLKPNPMIFISHIKNIESK